MKIASVVGTRPNFMKIAPVAEALARHGLEHYLVHTGQHYDKGMSELFFEQLGLPTPDVNLEVGSASNVQQIAAVMSKLEPVLRGVSPDLVVVVGDVNSTLAAALAAHELGIPVAHVEAGLRSFDRRMPEEINRMLTDAISDFLFTTEESAAINLNREGIASEKIHFVGNVMIDTLVKHKDRAARSNVLSRLGVSRGAYAALTLHRPSNVDTEAGLQRVVALLRRLESRLPLVLPIHPRTRKNLQDRGLLQELESMPHVVITEPLGYLDFLALMVAAKFVLTDSGGIQEETTVLGVPCLTFRENTERPVTVTDGTNLLVSIEEAEIVEMVDAVLEGRVEPNGRRPPLWDGAAAERIVTILQSRL